MDLEEFKKQTVKYKFSIDQTFGRVFSFIDFGNVDYWFEDDRYDANGNVLPTDKKLSISLENLANFGRLFSERVIFYFGVDSKKSKSIGFIDIARNYFDKVNSKEVQRIKHYLNEQELKSNTRSLNYDLTGTYVYLPKCNFDVEICIDAIRLIEKYDTFCLFSSDADFTALVRFLKSKKKKFILVKGGFAQYDLKKLANITIQAQDIKRYITYIKQKSSN